MDIAVRLLVDDSEPQAQEAARRVTQLLYERRPAHISRVTTQKTRDRGALHTLKSRAERTGARTGDYSPLAAILEPATTNSPRIDDLANIDGDTPIEVIFFRLSFENDSEAIGSASLLETSCPIVTTETDVVEAVRKAAIRRWAQSEGITVGIIPECQLDQYFRLRYEVYKEEQFIPEELDARQCGWELHYEADPVLCTT